MLFSHLNWKFRINLFLAFGIWLCASACQASEFELEPFFNVIVAPHIQAESHSSVDYAIFDDDYSPEPPHVPGDYVLDENLWGTGMSQAFSQNAFAQSDSFARITLRWDAPTSAFMVDAYTRSSAQSFVDQHNADCQSIAQLAGEIGVNVNPDTLSAGNILFCRVPSSNPMPYAEGGIGAGAGLRFYSRYLLNRYGPQWSGIYESMPEDADPDFTIIQVADKIDLYWSSMVSCQTIAYDIDLETYELGHAPVPAQFDILVPGVEDITEHIAGTGQRFESSDQSPFPCSYAAMAMVMDYWADQYPQLRQSEPNDYYAAFDLCRNENDPNNLEKVRRMMNRYLRNETGCRSGGPAPICAPRVKGLWEVLNRETKRDFNHPFYAAGPEVDSFGEPISGPNIINIGHAFVVDGLRGYKNPSEPGQYEYWMAVRDTWGSSLELDEVVSVYVVDSEWGPMWVPRYTGFISDGMEWWPVDNDLTYHLNFPNRQYYSFLPLDAIPIVPDGQIFGVAYQLFNYDDPDLISYSGGVGIDPDEVLVSTVKSIQDEGDYILRVQVPIVPQATVSFPSYVPPTNNLQIHFDYHLSPGSSLDLYSNGILLGPVGFGSAPMSSSQASATAEIETLNTPLDPNTPFDPNNFTHYSQVFDMNSLQLDNQEGVFSLVFTGPSGRILHIDNFIAENLDVVWPAVNLDGVGGIDFNDFVVLASVWLRQDCVAPFWCDGGDINQDHEASFEDLFLLSENWLDTPI